MNQDSQTIQLEKLHRISKSVMQLQDIPSLARIVSETMDDYMDTGLGIIEDQEVVLYFHKGVYRLPIGRGSLIGCVAERGETLLVNNVDQDERYLEMDSEADLTRSELVVPIKKDDQVLGVLDLHDDVYDAFSDGDLQFAESLAQVLSIAIQNAMLYENSRKQAERLSLVAEIAGDLTILQSTPNLLEQIVQTLGDRLGHIYVGIGLIEDQEIVVKAVYDPENHHPVHTTLRMRLDEGISGEVATSGKGLIVPNVQEHPSYVGTSGIMNSALLVPIKAHTRTLGIINVENPQTDAFKQRDLDLLQTLANQVAVALENARLYQMLQEAQEQLVQSERLRAVGELAAGVAHNFNNVLTCIIGYTELLQSEQNLKPYDAQLDIIMQSANQGAVIARRLQDFTRLRPDTMLHPVEINEIIDQALRITEPRWSSESLDEQGVSIRINLQLTDIPIVSGNVPELVEVFTNLILNGVDAMQDDGGTLTIETKSSGGYVQTLVTDTGVGMDSEMATRIFEPFYTTKGPALGLGLGLSVVHGIVSRHHGSIHLNTNPGEGSTFTVSLPIRTDEPQESSHNGTGDVPKQRILIIDDESDIQKMLTHMLNSHEVHTADAGDKGIQLFQKFRHDIIFTDIGMPGLSGWNVAHVAHQTDPTVVVVAITGWGKHFASGQRQVSDVDMFLAKPFTRDELLHVLSKAVKLRVERLST